MKKLILDIIMVVLVFTSVVISIKSCNVSEVAVQTAKNAIDETENSNRIAREALEISKNQFIQTNRPYLIIGPKRFENGQFWKVIQNGKTIEIDLEYEIKNVGNVAAKNVSYPNKLEVGPKMNLKDDAPFSFQNVGKVSLGPGETLIGTVKIKIDYDSINESKKVKEHLISSNSHGTLFQLSVNYINSIDETQQYRTFMLNKIHNDTAQVIKSEMLMQTVDKK